MYLDVQIACPLRALISCSLSERQACWDQSCSCTRNILQSNPVQIGCFFDQRMRMRRPYWIFTHCIAPHMEGNEADIIIVHVHVSTRVTFSRLIASIHSGTLLIKDTFLNRAHFFSPSTVLVYISTSEIRTSL